MQKKKLLGGPVGGGVWIHQGGCKPRIEVIVKKKAGMTSGRGGGGVGQGGCKPRIDGIVKGGVPSGRGESGWIGWM